MTKDEIKQQFKRCATLHEECGTIRRRIEDKREDMHYLRAVVTSGTYSRSSNISDKVEHVIELMDGTRPWNKSPPIIRQKAAGQAF